MKEANGTEQGEEGSSSSKGESYRNDMVFSVEAGTLIMRSQH